MCGTSEVASIPGYGSASAYRCLDSCRRSHEATVHLTGCALVPTCGVRAHAGEDEEPYDNEMDYEEERSYCRLYRRHDLHVAALDLVRPATPRLGLTNHPPPPPPLPTE